jgi:hypothetical protein
MGPPAYCAPHTHSWRTEQIKNSITTLCTCTANIYRVWGWDCINFSVSINLTIAILFVFSLCRIWARLTTPLLIQADRIYPKIHILTGIAPYLSAQMILICPNPNHTDKTAKRSPCTTSAEYSDTPCFTDEWNSFTLSCLVALVQHDICWCNVTIWQPSTLSRANC